MDDMLRRETPAGLALVGHLTVVLRSVVSQPGRLLPRAAQMRLAPQRLQLTSVHVAHGEHFCVIRMVLYQDVLDLQDIFLVIAVSITVVGIMCLVCVDMNIEEELDVESIAC